MKIVQINTEGKKSYFKGDLLHSVSPKLRTFARPFYKIKYKIISDDQTIFRYFSKT